EPEVCVAFQQAVHRLAGDFKVHSVERFAFYEMARKAACIVATTEFRLYGNIILKKGVVHPHEIFRAWAPGGRRLGGCAAMDWNGKAAGGLENTPPPACPPVKDRVAASRDAIRTSNGRHRKRRTQMSIARSLMSRRAFVALAGAAALATASPVASF